MQKQAMTRWVGLTGLAISVFLGAVAGAEAGSFPDDVFDVTVTGDTVQVKGKGNKEAKGHGFQVSKSKKGSGPAPGIEAKVQDRATGKSAELKIVEGGVWIEGSRGNRHVHLHLTSAGVEVFRFVGDPPRPPELPRPTFDPTKPSQIIELPKRVPDATCSNADVQCIAREVKKVLSDLSAEELAVLVAILRDDLATMPNGDRILETLRKLAGH